MLKVMNKKPPARREVRPGPEPARRDALPNVAASGGATAATPASSGQLVDTDVPPASGAGQLVSFSVFDTKNPFTPQVSSQLTPAGSATTSPTTANKSGADVPTTTTTTTDDYHRRTPPAVSAVPSSPGSPSATTTTTPALPTVSLSVNGVVFARCKRRHVPVRRTRLPARIVDEGQRADRDRRRLLRDGHRDDDAPRRGAGDAREPDRREALQARVALDLVKPMTPDQQHHVGGRASAWSSC